METIEQYHASHGLSYSGLKEFAKTPAHYKIYLTRERQETTAQRLGTLAHMAILEPERFFSKVAMIDGNRNATAVKERIAAAESEGKYVCKPDEFYKANRLLTAIKRHPKASILLSNGVAEQSIRWIDDETGLEMKCRPDFLRADGVGVDVKTYNLLTDRSLERQINDMKYHWQSQFYLWGIQKKTGIKTNMFAHLFVEFETEQMRIVVLDDAALEKAEFDMRPLIQSFAECKKNDSWPGYPEEISTISLPSYAW